MIKFHTTTPFACPKLLSFNKCFKNTIESIYSHFKTPTIEFIVITLKKNLMFSKEKINTVHSWNNKDGAEE